MHAAATLNKAALYDPLDSRPLFSTCAGVTITATHGEVFHGNSRIARIENGRVPCMNAETGETAECLTLCVHAPVTLKSPPSRLRCVPLSQAARSVAIDTVGV